MGYFSTDGASKADIIRELLTPGHTSGHILESHEANEDGQPILWVVVGGETIHGQDFQLICCYLLRKESKGWGYKPVNETEGPSYYSVPLEWLDKYPCIIPTPPQSDQWRADVKKKRA